MEYLQHLRAEINKKFVSNIASATDCETLAAAIFLKTQHRLSNDTIRRLFAIKKSTSHPSLFTLDVCAQYLEYQNWEDFVQFFLEQSALHQKNLLFDIIAEQVAFEELLSRINSYIQSTDLYANFNKIILYKAQIRDEGFFKRLFEFTPIFEYKEEHKYDIYYTIHLLGSLCDRYDWLGSIAIQYYHTIPYDNNYFVEWLVVPEKKYYLPLLENYFENNRNIKSIAIFYHIIWSTHFIKEQNWEGLDAHFKKSLPLLIGSFTPNSILKMRLLGVQMFHDFHFNNGSQKNTIWKKIFNNPLLDARDSGDRITSIFIISLYLIQLKEYEMIIALFEQKAIKSTTLLGHWGSLNFNQLKVLYALALLQTDKTEAARRVYNQIKANQFDMNFKTQMLEAYKILAAELN
ncbi:hypothetical protein [Flavobacterium sp. N1994]|uniref:hypothetical protein n=1 Tax=Flavobacterium sp. N1994 TaxID=2986827 RepID=UPI00222157D0|nr:hypothetical protein [Flavobacterium sp. N1994]